MIQSAARSWWGTPWRRWAVGFGLLLLVEVAVFTYVLVQLYQVSQGANQLAPAPLEVTRRQVLDDGTICYTFRGRTSVACVRP